MTGSTVLIVDDERTLARAVKAFLSEAGYEAEVAGDAERALELVESLRPDVVFANFLVPAGEHRLFRVGVSTVASAWIEGSKPMSPSASPRQSRMSAKHSGSICPARPPRWTNPTSGC